MEGIKDSDADILDKIIESLETELEKKSEFNKIELSRQYQRFIKAHQDGKM